jgi:multidrug resistance efflux pump
MAIQQLKTRTLADQFANDVRASRRKWGRYIYIFITLGVLAGLGKMFIGEYIWLEAGGMVAAERNVVTLPNEAQVRSISVSAGQTVHKGDILGYVHSADVNRSLADFKTRYADAAAKVAALNIQLKVAAAVLPAAIRRYAIASENLGKLQANRSLVSDLNYQAELREVYQAQFEISTQQAQKDAAQDQLGVLNASLEDARRTIAEIQANYNNGVVVADADAIIGDRLAQKGDVLHPGDLLVEEFVGRRFVLAYLKTDTLYDVQVGEKVNVASGFRSTHGRIVEVRPIAVQLPAEFQQTFRPRGRGQVAKIVLDDASFPINTKVQITGDDYLPQWLSGNGLIDFFRSWFHHASIPA